MQNRNYILLLHYRKRHDIRLGYGVMVTLQILVLSFQVRILVAQQRKPLSFERLFRISFSLANIRPTCGNIRINTYNSQEKRLPHIWDNLFLFWYSEKTPTKIINLYDRSYFGAARRLQNRSIPDVCEDFASKADDEIAL